jgi:hypothetical protein
MTVTWFPHELHNSLISGITLPTPSSQPVLFSMSTAKGERPSGIDSGAVLNPAPRTAETGTHILLRNISGNITQWDISRLIV